MNIAFTLESFKVEYKYETKKKEIHRDINVDFRMSELKKIGHLHNIVTGNLTIQF
jgi:hypothetical protein